jgi:hypothetical protein
LLQAAQDAESAIKDVFDLLGDSVQELRGEVDSTNQMQAEVARALIRRALTSATLPSADLLQSAIDGARSGLDSRLYASATDRDRERLMLANDLAALRGMAEPQLSVAEQQVVLLESQLEALDAQLKAAEDQRDALLGIDNSVQSVAQAMSAMTAAMASYTSQLAAAAGVAVAASAPAASAFSSGGGYSGPRSASVWNAAGYWNKNADLRTYYSANQGWLDAQFGGRDQYLQWHWGNYGQKESRKFAQGGAFTNGIVSSPTFFDMGLMGEKAPEAIMPLASINGSLGVRAITGADPESKALMRELIAELRSMRAETRSTALSTGQMAQRLEIITQRGPSDAVHTQDTRPLKTTIQGVVQTQEVAA